MEDQLGKDVFKNPLRYSKLDQNKQKVDATQMGEPTLSSTSWKIVFFLSLVLLTLGVSWFYLNFQSYRAPSDEVRSPVQASPVTSSISVRENRWAEYKDPQYRFSLLYPVDWNYKVDDPYIPNLAEHTVTFSSQDGNSVLAIWVRKDNWKDLVSKISKEPDVRQDVIAGLPAIVQPIGETGQITFVKHTILPGRVIILSISQGHPVNEHLQAMSEMKRSLKLE